MAEDREIGRHPDRGEASAGKSQWRRARRRAGKHPLLQPVHLRPAGTVFYAAFGYISKMETDRGRFVIPSDYPQLKQLVWSRDPMLPLMGADALAIYERNWRFIDEKSLTDREADLIRDLAIEFGHGVLLGS